MPYFVPVLNVSALPSSLCAAGLGLAVVDVESPVAEEEEEEGMEERPSTIDVAETAYLPRASNASELPNEEQRKLTGRDRYDYSEIPAKLLDS